MKIAFLGGGNMASAMIGGLLNTSGTNSITVVEHAEPQRQVLAARFGVRAIAKVDDEFINSNLIVLAVKPQQMKAALAGLPTLNNVVVLSIAAGLNIASLSGWLAGYRKIVRAMPNTPSLLAVGVAGYFADSTVSDEELAQVEAALRALGKVYRLQSEAQVDAVTAISGSGPAYFFAFIEALEQAAQQMGLTAELARALAVETAYGSAVLARQSEHSPGQLRQQVTSPGGTTEAALRVFNENGLTVLVASASEAARLRSMALAKELGEL